MRARLRAGAFGRRLDGTRLRRRAQGRRRIRPNGRCTRPGRGAVPQHRRRVRHGHGGRRHRILRTQRPKPHADRVHHEDHDRRGCPRCRGGRAPVARFARHGFRRRRRGRRVVGGLARGRRHESRCGAQGAARAFGQRCRRGHRRDDRCSHGAGHVRSGSRVRERHERQGSGAGLHRHGVRQPARA